MKYAILLEQESGSWGASVPDLPGCVAAGSSKDQAIQLIKEAIEFHIEQLKLDGKPIPQPACLASYVEVAA